MKLAVIGANGNLGTRVTKQALDRGIAVKGFIYDGETPDARAELVKKSLFDVTAEDIADCDAVVSAYGSGFKADPKLNHQAFLKYIALCENSGRHLIAIGGAGSLFTDETHTTYCYETPEHPDFLREISKNIKLGIDELKKRYHDARHNCWCYILRQGGVVRYSDDGEPQGTAGQPMLGVFQKESIENVCCVVTRYFGGILLGAGGLTRAYGRSAKDALDAAGVSVVRPWSVVECQCPYPLFERLKLELAGLQGTEGEHEFGSDILFRALLPQGAEEDFARRVGELSAGGSAPKCVCTQWKAVPRG